MFSTKQLSFHHSDCIFNVDFYSYPLRNDDDDDDNDDDDDDDDDLLYIMMISSDTLRCRFHSP